MNKENNLRSIGVAGEQKGSEAWELLEDTIVAREKKMPEEQKTVQRTWWFPGVANQNMLGVWGLWDSKNAYIGYCLVWESDNIRANPSRNVPIVLKFIMLKQIQCYAAKFWRLRDVPVLLGLLFCVGRSCIMGSCFADTPTNWCGDRKMSSSSSLEKLPPKGLGTREL